MTGLERVDRASDTGLLLAALTLCSTIPSGEIFDEPFTTRPLDWAALNFTRLAAEYSLHAIDSDF